MLRQLIWAAGVVVFVTACPGNEDAPLPAPSASQAPSTSGSVVAAPSATVAPELPPPKTPREIAELVPMCIGKQNRPWRCRAIVKAWAAEGFADSMKRYLSECDGGDNVSCMLYGFARASSEVGSDHFDKAQTAGLDRPRGHEHAMLVKACEAGERAACAWVAYNVCGTEPGSSSVCPPAVIQYYAPHKSKGIGQAFALVEPGCKAGYFYACRVLASLYGQGLEPTTATLESAVKSWPKNQAWDRLQKLAHVARKTACDAGDLKSCWNNGGTRNSAPPELSAIATHLARRSFELAREKCTKGGDCEDLASAHYSGKGTARNRSKAAEIYARDCNREEPRSGACMNAAQMSERWGTPPDEELVARTYKAGCPNPEQFLNIQIADYAMPLNMKNAIRDCMAMARILFDGIGVPKNEALAAKMAKKALSFHKPAGGPNPYANDAECTLLARAQFEGRGTKKEDASVALATIKDCPVGPPVDPEHPDRRFLIQLEEAAKTK